MIDPHQDAMQYWQRLRKDKASNLAVGGLVVGALATATSLLVLVFPHSDGAMHNRGNPLYWLLVLPFALWAWDLSTFSPRSAWTMRPAMVLLPAFCGVILIIAACTGRDVLRVADGSGSNVRMTLVALLAATAGSLVSGFSLPRSLLHLEGPDRRLMKPEKAARQSGASRPRAEPTKSTTSIRSRHPRF